MALAVPVVLKIKGAAIGEARAKMLKAAIAVALICFVELVNRWAIYKIMAMPTMAALLKLLAIQPTRTFKTDISQMAVPISAIPRTRRRVIIQLPGLGNDFARFGANAISR